MSGSPKQVYNFRLRLSENATALRVKLTLPHPPGYVEIPAFPRPYNTKKKNKRRKQKKKQRRTTQTEQLKTCLDLATVVSNVENSSLLLRRNDPSTSVQDGDINIVSNFCYAIFSRSICFVSIILPSTSHETVTVHWQYLSSFLIRRGWEQQISCWVTRFSRGESSRNFVTQFSRDQLGSLPPIFRQRCMELLRFSRNFTDDI